ncbi:MAG TPA: DUF2867 domain-containing protein [Bradyrhizobium sp.]|nr:DUF2867 domain-containing protein [Bradyrhizobium sp.]
MNVREITPDVDPAPLLAGAQFVDAYRVEMDGAALDAREAARRMFARSPRWAEALLNLRNLVVAPLGLKTSGAGERAAGGMIGIFPVVSETPERLVAGFNDSHLDFRVVVDVMPAGAGQQVTLTTLVRTHNWLGRAYLAIILPFHRLIARSMLRRVAA